METLAEKPSRKPLFFMAGLAIVFSACLWFGGHDSVKSAPEALLLAPAVLVLVAIAVTRPSLTRYDMACLAGLSVVSVSYVCHRFFGTPIEVIFWAAGPVVIAGYVSTFFAESFGRSRARNRPHGAHRRPRETRQGIGE